MYREDAPTLYEHISIGYKYFIHKQVVRGISQLLRTFTLLTSPDFFEALIDDSKDWSKDRDDISLSQQAIKSIAVSEKLFWLGVVLLDVIGEVLLLTVI